MVLATECEKEPEPVPAANEKDNEQCGSTAVDRVYL